MHEEYHNFRFEITIVILLSFGSMNLGNTKHCFKCGWDNEIKYLINSYMYVPLPYLSNSRTPTHAKLGGGVCEVNL